MKQNYKVLITDAYARQTLPMAKAFKELGCTVTVLCFSKLDVGYASKYPDKKIILNCKKDDYDKQLEIIEKLAEKGLFDIIVPMNDYSALFLSRNKERLSKYSKIAVNDWPIFNLAIDKLNTMRICEKYDIPSPKTFLSDKPFDELEIKKLRFPVVVKPRTACGSIGFNIVKDKDKLCKLLLEYDHSLGPLLIQEYIPQSGSQYGAEVFRDKKGNFTTLIIDEKPRWFPLDGGSPTMNFTIENKRMEQICKDLLNAMNWNGYANIDFVVDSRTNEPLIIEVNARISAAVKLCYVSGVNIASQILENEFGEDVTSYPTYNKDVRISCMHTELLWFIKSKDRTKTKPSWFNRDRTSDVIFSWDDPVPFFTFSMASLMNYKREMKKRHRKD